MTTSTTQTDASASSAHDMVISIGIMSAFVYAMVIVAGTSRGAGRAIAALFVALLVLQGLGRINPFGFFAQHPLTRVAPRVQTTAEVATAINNRTN